MDAETLRFETNTQYNTTEGLHAFEIEGRTYYLFDEYFPSLSQIVEMKPWSREGSRSLSGKHSSRRAYYKPLDGIDSQNVAIKPVTINAIEESYDAALMFAAKGDDHETCAMFARCNPYWEVQLAHSLQKEGSLPFRFHAEKPLGTVYVPDIGFFNLFERISLSNDLRRLPPDVHINDILFGQSGNRQIAEQVLRQMGVVPNDTEVLTGIVHTGHGVELEHWIVDFEMCYPLLLMNDIRNTHFFKELHDL